jgi:hypothetical protein
MTLPNGTVNGIGQLGTNNSKKVDNSLVNYDGSAQIIMMNGVRDRDEVA